MLIFHLISFFGFEPRRDFRAKRHSPLLLFQIQRFHKSQKAQQKTPTYVRRTGTRADNRTVIVARRRLYYKNIYNVHEF